jgi:hypothetical protein
MTGEEYFVFKTATVVLALVFLALFAKPMSAQLIPHGNVYVGGSFASAVDVINRNDYKGWAASAEALPFHRFTHLGLVLDGAGLYRPGVTKYNAVFGPRVSMNFGKWRPFVHAMAGTQRLTTGGIDYDPLVIDAGGGVDYKLFFRNFSWRLQADGMRTHLLSATQYDYRASTGLVWRF